MPSDLLCDRNTADLSGRQEGSEFLTFLLPRGNSSACRACCILWVPFLSTSPSLPAAHLALMLWGGGASQGMIPGGGVHCEAASQVPQDAPCIALDPRALPVTVPCIGAKTASGERKDNSSFTIIIVHV